MREARAHYKKKKGGEGEEGREREQKGGEGKIYFKRIRAECDAHNGNNRALKQRFTTGEASGTTFVSS